MKQIGVFVDEYRFLSNFWVCAMNVDDPVLGETVVVPSVEHGYQGDKTVIPQERRAVLTADSPRVAKRKGRKVSLRHDWDIIRDDRMRFWLSTKFANPALREMLLKTGDANLIHGNWWGDIYWGTCRGTGYNKLGRMLMECRTNLRSLVR